VIGKDKDIRSQKTHTKGHRSRFAFSVASLAVLSCSGASVKACERAISVAWASLRSAAVGSKYSSGNGAARCYVGQAVCGTPRQLTK